MAKPFPSISKWIDFLSNHLDAMLIVTGAIGWAASSAAQIGAILFNPKISKEEKSFLVPQEAADAIVNIGAFLLITKSASKLTEKMFKTGKIGTKSVKEFLEKNKNTFEKKVGHLDFNLDEVLKDKPELLEKYNISKSFGTTLATVAASVLAVNVVTPLTRNAMASKVQKNYIASVKEEQQPAVKHEVAEIQPITPNSGNLRI